jgi:hypothetical protein
LTKGSSLGKHLGLGFLFLSPYIPCIVRRRAATVRIRIRPVYRTHTVRIRPVVRIKPLHLHLHLHLRLRLRLRRNSRAPKSASLSRRNNRSIGGRLICSPQSFPLRSCFDSPSLRLFIIIIVSSLACASSPWISRISGRILLLLPRSYPSDLRFPHHR